MANADRPNGATPVGTISGSPWSGYVRAYPVVASAANIFMGDFVKLETDGNIDTATAGDAVIGVMVGWLPQFPAMVNFQQNGNFLSNTDPTLIPNYSSGAGVALVCVGTDVIYEMQEDGAATPLTGASIGTNVDILATAGSTTTGRSQMEIDSSSSTTASAQLRIVGLVDRPDNQLASVDTTTPNARWLVKINESHFNLIDMSVTTGSVGPVGI